MLWPSTRWLQLAVAAGLIGSLALIGHAGASPDAAGRVHLASDVLHLIAAGAWVGALPALALLLHQTRKIKYDRSILVASGAARRFSPLGIASVGTLLATGVVNSWNLLAGPRDLITTDYGRLLLLKIGLFAAMVGIAAVNRFRLTPRLAAPGAVRVRWSATASPRSGSASLCSCSSARWEPWRRRSTTMFTSRANRSRLTPPSSISIRPRRWPT